MSDRKTEIYVMTHKPFTVPSDPIYIPVHVGRRPWREGHPGENSKLLSYTGDDSGDNISDRNCYYSELTGMYWVWKNVSCDYVGICHYRRYLLNRQGFMFTSSEIEHILTEYDVITTKNLDLNFSYYEGFAANHKRIYLDTAAAVLGERYPDYFAVYDRLVHEKHTYFGNMLITDKTTYDAYMEWLFSVLFEVQRRVKVEEEDSYHRRIFGFLSEFIQYVWITGNGLRAYECMVGMLGEKAEVTETKQRLADFFDREDFEGAKAFFLERLKQRPDLLMEASDVTGELHLCMEVIAIAGLEQQAYQKNLLQRIHGFDQLMQYCNHLNSYVAQKKSSQVEERLIRWAGKQEISDVAYRTAEAVMEAALGQEKFPIRG